MMNLCRGCDCGQGNGELSSGEAKKSEESELGPLTRD